MARTDLQLDEQLVSEAMRRYGLPSKRATVDYALRRLIGEAMTRDEALAIFKPSAALVAASYRLGMPFT